MPQLAHRHLLTLSLDVDFAGMVTIGPTARGLRRIAPVTGGSFSGELLSGTVHPGADWVINRRDGIMEIDVRLTLSTDDGAAIYLAYQGRLLAAAEAMQRFAKGTLLDPADYSLTVIARFECGADRYAWLNDSICVGTGTQHPHGPVYEFFTLG
jgi:hypothetical protein